MSASASFQAATCRTAQPPAAKEAAVNTPGDLTEHMASCLLASAGHGHRAASGRTAHPVLLEASLENRRQNGRTVRVRHKRQRGALVQAALPAAREERGNPAEARPVPEPGMLRTNLAAVLWLLLCASSSFVEYKLLYNGVMKTGLDKQCAAVTSLRQLELTPTLVSFSELLHPGKIHAQNLAVVITRRGAACIQGRWVGRTGGGTGPGVATCVQ